MWGKEQQIAFEEIKCRLIKLPVLHLPDSKGRFHLHSDMSKSATGSALYQIQNGKTKLISYANKRLPKNSKKLFDNRIRDVWFSYKYCWFHSFIK